MSLRLWRIAADAPSYLADDLSGTGARLTGGRWNEVGHPVVYASESRALACLETVVHLAAGAFPFNRYLVELTVPDDVFAAAKRESAAGLPVGWDAEPAGRVSLQVGTDWLRGCASALLFVPSVVVAEEYNVLINPLHADAARLTATKLRKWVYDPRLTRASA